MGVDYSVTEQGIGRLSTDTSHLLSRHSFVPIGLENDFPSISLPSY
jgi:hypothetical protein